MHADDGGFVLAAGAHAVIELVPPNRATLSGRTELNCILTLVKSRHNLASYSANGIGRCFQALDRRGSTRRLPQQHGPAELLHFAALHAGQEIPTKSETLRECTIVTSTFGRTESGCGTSTAVRRPRPVRALTHNACFASPRKHIPDLCYLGGAPYDGTP